MKDAKRRHAEEHTRPNCGKVRQTMEQRKSLSPIRNFGSLGLTDNDGTPALNESYGRIDVGPAARLGDEVGIVGKCWIQWLK